MINHLQDNALNGIRKKEFSQQTDVPQFRELDSSLSTESVLLSMEFPLAKLMGLVWPLIIGNV